MTTKLGTWAALSPIIVSLLAASACTIGSDDNPPAQTGFTADAVNVAIAADGHRVEIEACDGADPNCATDVPMTGNPSELFAEVDQTMRRFMKSQCISAGALAINYKGRRVYKRGFGRMSGSSMETLPAHCQQDAYDASSDYVLPDTDTVLGSVAKVIPAMMVRELVAERITEQGLEATYPDPTQALLLDPDLELLPPKLLRLLDQTRPDAQCPPVAGSATCLRAGVCSGTGPDSRWQNITIGDLLGHTAALPGKSPSTRITMDQLQLLRGLNDYGDWSLQHLTLRGSTSYQPELDAAQQYIANAAGVDVSNVLFMPLWDQSDPATHPIDEVIMLMAGTCLRSDVNPASQSDTTPSPRGPYANGGFVLLERIITHLHSASYFSAHDGEPWKQKHSAVQSFLEDEGIEAGVQNDYAIFTRQKLALEPGGPDRRQWDDAAQAYMWKTTSWLRPFCIWDGATCDMSLWQDGSAANDIYRLPVNFSTNEFVVDPVTDMVVATGKPPLVHFAQAKPDAAMAPGTGQLAFEVPALLHLFRKYHMGVNNDVRIGRSRQECGAICDVTGKKGGLAAGIRAEVMTLRGGGKSGVLPPLTVAASLSMEPDVTQWANVAWDDADNVDFVVMIHQTADEQQGSDGYTSIEESVRYALSRVDWDAVDQRMDRQRMNVVATAINAAGNAYYWYEDDHRETLSGLPNTHHLQPAGIPVIPPPADDWAPAGGAPPPPNNNYDLPSTRIGSDVVGMAITDYDRVYAWYDDGHVSAGNSLNLSATLTAARYTVPAGYSYNDIVGMGISSGDTVVSWFSNSMVGFGDSKTLGLGLFHYTLPPGQTHDQISGMSIDKSNDHVLTVFKDGSVAEGTYLQLDAYSYRPGRTIGMAMRKGNTTIWYLSGYRKDLSGSPADNRINASVRSSSDYYRLPAGYDYDDVAGLAQATYFQPQLWFRNGARSTANSAGDFLSAGAAGTTTWPIGQNGNFARGFAISGSGSVYSWYNTSRRARGTVSNLANNGDWPSFDLPAQQSEFTIDGMAIDSGIGGDGDVWTVYEDGAVSRGRSWELDDIQYWASPHTNPI